jgi:hypothetical protein
MQWPDFLRRGNRVAPARQQLEFDHGHHKIRAKVVPLPLGLGFAPRWRVEVDGDEQMRLGPIFREGESEHRVRSRIQKWIRKGCKGEY